MQPKNAVHLAKDFDWIRAHPLATNHDVPRDLLLAWMFDNTGPHPKPAGYHASVFAFGHMHALLRRSGSLPGPALKLPTEQMTERFLMWQVKLSLALLNRESELGVGPLRLFEFDDDESVQFWNKQAGN